MSELKRYYVNYDMQYSVGLRDKRTLTNQEMFVQAESIELAHKEARNHVHSLYKKAYVIINSCVRSEK